MIEEVGEIVVQTVLVEMEAAVGIAVTADGERFEGRYSHAGRRRQGRERGDLSGIEGLAGLTHDVAVRYHQFQGVHGRLCDGDIQIGIEMMAAGSTISIISAPATMRTTGPIREESPSKRSARRPIFWVLKSDIFDEEQIAGWGVQARLSTRLFRQGQAGRAQ